MLNKAMLIGRLGKDPEMRHTATGAPVCTMSIATNSFRIDRNTGEKSNTTEWHNIVCWNRTAENVAQYLRKGSLVYVEGRIQYRTWQAQDGTTRNSTEIVASDVKFLDSKASREGFQGAGYAQQQPGAWQGADLWRGQLSTTERTNRRFVSPTTTTNANGRRSFLFATECLSQRYCGGFVFAKTTTAATCASAIHQFYRWLGGR